MPTDADDDCIIAVSSIPAARPKNSTNAVAKMSKNEYVSLDTIVKICYALDCGIEDVIEVVIERQVNQ